MRVTSRIALLAILSALVLLPHARPADAYEIKLCEHCRRIWDDSPSRIRGNADANGRPKQIYVCSPYCLAEVLQAKSHYKLETVQIVHWDERAELKPMLLNTANAKFLISVKDEQDESHDPDIAAFRTDKQLSSAKANVGGTTITWAKIMEKCKKLAAESEDEEDSDYSPLHFRKY
jgi:hypothetical protein